MIEWRKVKLPFYSHYEISNDGVLLNTRTGRLSYGHSLDSGAMKFYLHNGDYSKNIMAHKLVLIHFKRKEINKNYGLHLNNILWDNESDNLEWATLGEVIRHKRLKKGNIRGVYKYNNTNSKKKWRAAITIGKTKTKTIGYYNKKLDAIIAYEKEYLKLYKEYPYKKVYAL